ncbi:luciferin 4-monooxygenase [Rhipicephalus sanguineus]|uniref:luciferin 4-monooxygenase n=1 Tax=Rhipicephalus sanguineus TaxID=34632 RepID=UPI0020C35E97|nr:luciferin 4-monooxygenase [Rhipicephalus sanguineus]
MMEAPIKDGVVSSPYPPVELIQDETLYQHIQKRFLEHGDKPALERNGELLTFADVLSLIERYAIGFQRYGVSSGSRVCVSAANSAESLIAAYSLCCLGATVVLVKTTLPEHPTPDFVCVRDFERNDCSEFQAPRIEDTKNHIMLQVYTSGTTGLPKALEISMYAYITKVEYSRATEFFEDKDVVLEWNPLTHMCGFVIPMIAFLTGAMVVPSTGGLSPKEFVEIVNKHQPSRERRKVFELESLRNGYGMSEAIGFICMTAPKTTGYRSVGYPVPMAEYKIIDNASGRTLGPLEVGEITFRAPHLMRGYYKRPDETAQVFDEQRWFRSGDAGYYDRTGQLYIVERLKDMIKCLDQQVAPAELEALLTQHPLVLEAAVVGIDHPEFGEAPTAFVVIEPSAKGLVSEDELVRLVSDQTAFHKNLHGGVVFVDIIPKTDTGKYIRRKLRQGHLDLLKKSCYQP